MCSFWFCQSPVSISSLILSGDNLNEVKFFSAVVCLAPFQETEVFVKLSAWRFGSFAMDFNTSFTSSQEDKSKSRIFSATDGLSGIASSEPIS